MNFDTCDIIVRYHSLPTSYDVAYFTYDITNIWYSMWYHCDPRFQIMMCLVCNPWMCQMWHFICYIVHNWILLYVVPGPVLLTRITVPSQLSRADSESRLHQQSGVYIWAIWQIYKIWTLRYFSYTNDFYLFFVIFSVIFCIFHVIFSDIFCIFSFVYCIFLCIFCIFNYVYYISLCKLLLHILHICMHILKWIGSNSPIAQVQWLVSTPLR